jgi:hypothetical protein
MLAMLSAPFQVDELRCKLEEKNKMIEKKTQAALGATQDKNRLANELSELRDQVSVDKVQQNLGRRSETRPETADNM